MTKRAADDQYGERETQQRFERLVKSALNTRPKPLKDMPSKRPGKRRKRAVR
jgi:hypothetical protein